MKKEIIINDASTETRIAILEDRQLVELFVEHPENERMVGDIYKGKVKNVVQAIQAAFVDVGLGQNGFLPFADIGTELSSLSERVEGSKKKQGKAELKLKNKPVVKNGQEVLVQVTKEPIGNKGTRLTSSISLPGRFLVLVPNDRSIGVSRKIVNARERRRLRMLAKSLKPDGFGLIIRTVAVEKDVQTLQSDLENLVKTWKRIQEKTKKHKGPGLIHKDMGITSSIIRDLFSPDIDRLVVDSRKLYNNIRKYLKYVAPALLSKLELYKEQKPIFDKFNIEEEIDKSLSRKIWMKSGGHIIFDQTEAMVVVDVNSGRAVKEKDQEKNALKIDVEAARVIARQLRLRDSGGIVVIDFIDLAVGKNRQKVLSVLKKELNKDRAAFDILPMSDFGIVQLTRERVRPSLLYRYSEPCSRCDGSGRTLSKSAIATKIEREVLQLKSKTGGRRFVLRVHPDMEAYLTGGMRSRLRRLQFKFFVSIQLVLDTHLNDENFKLITLKEEKKPTS